MISALLKLIVGITLITAVAIFGPLAGLWSLNTLFPLLNIPYTFESWAAFFLLFGGLTGLRIGFKK
jgi:hypothetical protein